MKSTFLLALLTGTAGLCAAQNNVQNFPQNPGPEMGRVLSSMPMVSQVGVPRRVCTNESVPMQSQKSGAGAIMGGLAGGAIGNAVGGGGGRAAATLIGIFGGAILGDRVEGGGQPFLMLSEKRFYPSSQTQTTEAGIRGEAMGNLYISVGESATLGAATVRLWWHPLVGWIWGGAMIMALGGVLSLSDRRTRLAMPARKAARAKAPEAAA